MPTDPATTPITPPSAPAVMSAAPPESLAELKSQMQQAKERFETASTKHKERTFLLQKFVIGLTAAITIVSGVGLMPQGSEEKEWFQAGTMVLGAFSTAVTSWAAFRNYRDLWKLEREVYYSISDLLRTVQLHDKLTEGKIPRELMLQWFDSFNKVLSAAGDKWGQLFSKEQQKKNSPPTPPGTPADQPGATGEGTKQENPNVVNPN
jgi:hypothetical protein